MKGGGQMLLGKVDDLLAGNHLSVDAYALSEIDQVGRSIQPRFITVELQYRGQQVRYRTLPVGTGDVQGVEFAVGMPEVLVECFAVLQSRFVSRAPYLLKYRELPV